MRKKQLIVPLIAAVALSSAICACADSSAPSEGAYGASTSSEITSLTLGRSVTCQNNSGDSDPFEIHEAGRVRFYFTNNTDTDIVVAIHKDTILGTWGGQVAVNGKSEFEVPANDSVEINTDGSHMAKGTYRCEAFNEDGSDFDYICSLRELDYTP